MSQPAEVWGKGCLKRRALTPEQRERVLEESCKCPSCLQAHPERRVALIKQIAMLRRRFCCVEV